MAGIQPEGPCFGTGNLHALRGIWSSQKRCSPPPPDACIPAAGQASEELMQGHESEELDCVMNLLQSGLVVFAGIRIVCKSATLRSRRSRQRSRNLKTGRSVTGRQYATSHSTERATGDVAVQIVYISTSDLASSQEVVAVYSIMQLSRRIRLRL